MQVQLIDDVSVSIALIEDIHPALVLVRSFKYHLTYPAPASNYLYLFSRIPFQDRILTYLCVYRDFKSPVPDVQHFFQGLFHFLCKFIVLFYFLPELFLLGVPELKIIHIRQHNRG